MLAPNFPQPPAASTNPNHYDFSKGNQSEVKQKISNFRTQIRNHQIQQFKAKIRDEIFKVNSIEQMLKQTPFDRDFSELWASDLLALYGQAINFRLSPVQTVELFRLVEKFPNKATFQLLEVVIFKADLASIDQIFQYDVMKLLHSSITSSQKSRLSRSQSSEEQDRIIREAVVCPATCNKFKELSQTGSEDAELQLVRVTLRIIAQLCRKKSHIRNFAVLNHKTFTYCLKAFKQFGQEVKPEFYNLLGAVTFFPFQRNEQQFGRITNRLLVEIFRQNWEAGFLANERELEVRTSLLKGMFHLLNNKCGWIMFKLDLIEKKEKSSFFGIILYIVREFNKILQSHRGALSPNHCKLLKAAIDCAMILDELMEVTELTGPGWTQIHDRVALFLQLSHLLRQSRPVALLEQVRPGLYFMLGNYCLDEQIPQNIKQALVLPINGQDLLSFLSGLLFQELKEQNIYELSYFLQLLFEAIPFSVLEPLLFQSEILQSMCFKILDEGPNESALQPSKVMLLKAMLSLFGKLESVSGGREKPYKSMIFHQFSGQLCRLAGGGRGEGEVYRNVERLLFVLGEGGDY